MEKGYGYNSERHKDAKATLATWTGIAVIAISVKLISGCGSQDTPPPTRSDTAEATIHQALDPISSTGEESRENSSIHGTR